MRFEGRLRKLSAKSKHHRYRHACIIAKGSQIFAQAVNTDGHHAEVNAIVRAGENCKGATLYTLMTRSRDGSVGNGHPCPMCLEAIAQAKIKRVIVYV